MTTDVDAGLLHRVVRPAMRYASVCDGIGAVHCAWQPLGWHCEWTAEIDAFPAAVVEQRWGFPNRGDMTKFMEWNDESIELLVGGTPCQSFSVAGLRKGLHDPRGGLMLTFLEIAQRYRPRWVVWENVPGVLSSNGGRDFGAFLGALGELGYGWAYRVLDAQWFGVAQRRRRVFVVAHLGDWRRAAAVLFESESVRRDNPPSRAKGERASCPIAGCSNGGGANGPGRTADDADSLIPIWRGGDQGIGASGKGFERAGETRGQDPVVAQPYRVANCLTQRMHKGINTTCDEWQTPVLTPQAFYSNESRCDNIPPPDISPPVKVGSSGSGNPPAVAFKPSHYTRGKDGKPSEVTPPLSADADKGDQDVVVATSYSIRADAMREGVAKTPSPDAEGRVRLRDPGMGVYEEIAPTVDTGQPHGVAFTKSKRAQSTTDDESWVPGEVAPTFNCFDQGDTRATTVVAYDVHGTLAKKGASETDIHTALRSRTPGQSEASTTTVVAFTQNSRDEVRQINGDGQLAGALSAEAGMHQTNYIAFAQNQLGEVRTNSEVMGTVNTNQNASGRNTPMVMQGVGVDFQNCATTADACGTLMGEAQKKGGEAGQGVWTPMAVRRLTPRECERLQGFPDDYTAIQYRKKPAADGPRYKALGNSMAVPVMRWIGERIARQHTA